MLPEFVPVVVHDFFFLLGSWEPDDTRNYKIRQLAANGASPQRAVDIHTGGRRTATPVPDATYAESMITLSEQPKLAFSWSWLREYAFQTDAALHLLAKFQRFELLVLFLARFLVLLPLLGPERMQATFPASWAKVSVDVGALVATRAVTSCGVWADGLVLWFGCRRAEGEGVVWGIRSPRWWWGKWAQILFWSRWSRQSGGRWSRRWMRFEFDVFVPASASVRAETSLVEGANLLIQTKFKLVNE